MGRDLRRSLRRLGCALAASLGALALAAAVLRWRAAPAPPAEPWYRLSAALGWQPRPGFRGVAYGAERAFDEQGYLDNDGEQARRFAGQRRLIVAVGDSRVFGFGVAADAAFPARLEGELGGTPVLNLGVPGYSSWQTARAVALQAVPLRPAAVIVACGFNDRRSVLGSARRDGAWRFRRLAATAAAWELLSGRPLLRESADPGPAARAVDLRTLVPRVAAADYGRNLAAMAETARRHGFRLLLLRLPDNPRPLQPLLAARRALAAGQKARARALLEPSLRAQDELSDLALLLAATAAEDPQRAAHAVPFVSLHGGRPIRFQDDYDRAFHAVARREGVELVDASPILEARPERYLDLCHFDAEAHAAIARLLAAALAGSGLPATGDAD